MESLKEKYENGDMTGPSNLAQSADDYSKDSTLSSKYGSANGYNKQTKASSLPGTAYNPGLGQPEDKTALGLNDGSGTGVNGTSIYSFANQQLDNVEKNQYNNNNGTDDYYTKGNVTNP